jgi:uncharacterized protein YjdB
MVLLAGKTWGQLCTPSSSLGITSFSSNSLESITGYLGAAATTAPANWQLQGTGTRGNLDNGSAQTTGTSGGWYGNNNISFLGSGTASAANATLRMQNTTGSAITAFRVVYTGRMWKTGTASPAVSVTWSTATANAVPAAGALTNSLASLGFNDATSGIASGVQLAQSVTGASIPNNSYVFLRFIHAGGSSSDNLGWDEINFIPTPITQASAITFPSVGTTSMTVSWTNGNGRRRAAFMKASSAGTITNPADGTLYTASTTFGSGTQLGTSGYYCISDGTGSSVTVTGLTASTAYYVQVFEYNSDGTPTALSTTYLTTAVTANQTTNSSCTTPTAFTVSGTGSYCAGGSGVTINLSGSQTGVNYQLYNGAATVGSPVAGTGSGISFGSQTAAATYSATATTATGGCVANMTGSATVSINPAPVAQTMTGGGGYCAGWTGVAIGLANSQSGVDYQLYNGASAVGSPVSGTAAAISFGSFTASGTYSVLATNATTSCTATMSGSAAVSINPLPTPTISGTATISSGGSTILTFSGVSGDVVYYWDGASTISTTITGTGTSTVTVSPTVTTTYSVTSATSALGCSQSITGQTATVTVTTLPTAAITGTTTICPGASATLSFSGTAGATVYYNAGTSTPLSVTLSGSSGTGTATATVSPSSTTTYSLDSIVSGVYHGTLSGSVVITISTLPTAYTVTGGGSYCSGGAALSVGLSNSTTSVNYQLYNGPSSVGSPVAGTGSAISFGTFTASGTYSVVATNTLSCTSNMTGSVAISINANPVVYSVTGTGSYCSGGSGVAVGLSNSETGVDYQLYNGSTAVGSAISGTGSAISFGSMTTAATYTVTATNSTTGCAANMSGSAVITINPLPTAGTLTGTTTMSFGTTNTLTASGGDAGGTWSSSNIGVATVGTSGIVTGISAGTAAISYSVSNSCGASVAAATVTVTGPTSVIMSCQTGLSYTEDFSAIAGWANGFTSGTGAASWWPVGIIGSATIPDATRTTVSSATFSTSSSAGIQKGTNNLVFLTTGTTDNTTALAADFFMNFTGVNADTLSFTAAELNNNTGNRVSTLKVFYSTNGTTFTELTGSGLPFSATNNVASSANIKLALPSAFNNSATARLRFYYYNGSGGSTGSRPKITIDDLKVTAVTTVAPITGTLSVCTGANTSLADATSGGTWSSSNTGIATVGSAGTVSGIATGTASISYSVMNASGCSSSAIYVVTVNPVPSSTGATNNGPICVGGTVTLSANSSHATAWSWSGPSGFTSSLQNPSATPTTTGTYSLTLSSTGIGCSPTTVYTTTVTVNPVPSSTGATNNGPICVGGTVTLSANSSDATAWSWSGPSGFTSSLQNPTATPTATGTYSLTLSSTGLGCSPTTVYTTTVTVNPVPSSTGATNNGPICVGGTVILSANSSDATAWSWSGPSGFTSSLQNPTATPTATGTYSLTLSSTGLGCSPTTVYTTTVTVNPVPSSTGATNNGPICVGGTVTLSANSSDATSWSWSGPSGYTSTLQNPTATPTATGTYSLTLSSTGIGCSPTTVYTTTVTVNPVPSSTGATNNGPICVGGTVTLSSNSSDAIAWSWSGPSGFTSSLQNPTATPTTTGTYSLTLSSTGIGCSPTTLYTTTVTVNPVPSSTGATNNGPICVGGTITLSANSSDATAWSWSGPSGFTSSLQNPTATPTTTATYSLTLSSTGIGCSPTTLYTTTVTVNPVPSSTGASNNGPICVGGTVTLSANSSDATAWSWSGPSGFTSSLQNPTATPTATGTYSLTLSSTGIGCSPTTIYTTTVTVNPVPSSTGATNNGPICVGGSVTLSANSSDATSWSWSGPSGYTSSLQNPTATPTATGTYSLTLSSTGIGCSPTTVYTTTVTVNPVPSSTGATNNGPICVGGTVTLSANSTDAIAWSWSGPSGFTSSLQNPTATPTATGTYSLTLSSTGIGCSPTTIYTTTVTVNPVPSSTGATNNGPICVGGTVTLSANSSDATSWSWSGPSGFTSSLQNPTATPTATGTYSLTLSSTGIGCSPTTIYTTTVTVNPVPSSTGATNNGPICVGGSVTLSANSSDATSWSWSGPSGYTSSLQNPTATPTTTGTYSLTLSSTGIGCSPTTVYTTTVTVNPVPSSTGATNNGPICVGGTVTLSANSTDAIAWSWSGPSGFTSSLQNPTVTPTATGTYSLTLSSTGIGCSPTTIYTTTVTVNPVPSSTGATNNGPICVGGTVTLSANSTDATAWSWSGPSGFTSSLQNPTATPTTTGTYSLTLSSTGIGCAPTTVYTTAVTVNPVPSSTGATNNGPICVGGTVTLFSNSSDATSWSWSGPSGFTSTLQNPTATPTTTGTYSLTLSSTGIGCAPTTVYTTTVTVNPVPSSTGATNNGPICVGGTVTLSANSTDATSWSWSGPSGFTSSLQNPTATPTTTGTYSLTLSSTGIGCSPTTVYTTTVTVNPVPSSTGATNNGPICVGGTVTLSANSSDATSWSWSGPSGFTSSLQNPTATPTTTGTYSLTLSSTGIGCSPTTVYTTTVTVNPVPSSTGATNNGPICVGGTVTLSANSTDATSWSWSGPSGFTSSLQNPTATPTTTGTYSLTLSSTGLGCSPTTVYTTTVTVNPVPSSTGATNNGPICVGGTVTLSANSSNATSWSWIGPSGFTSSLQNPTATPTTTGSYSLTLSSTGIGCSPTTVYNTTVTVNPLPSSISGASVVCVGSSITLSNTGGGTWASANSSIAIVGSATGIVTGVTSGSVNITYILPTGCYVTKSVTVNPVPTGVSLTSSSNLCVGSNTTVTPSVSGGTWSVSNISVATIDTSGVVSGISSGTVTVTYSVVNAFGCSTNATAIITVNALPSVSAITGTTNICVGASTTLTSSTTGGVWSSSSSAVATVTSAGGVVSGVTAGTATISYIVTSAAGCASMTTATITVNSLPVITGVTNVCISYTTTLSSSVSGGTWSSSNTSRATVDATTGVVTGISTGTVVITYNSGCPQYVTVVVNPLPASITGTATVCEGSFTVLSNATSGSIDWSSSDTTIATVNHTSGAVTGVLAGTATITFTKTTTGCFVTRGVTVNTTPAAIAGSSSICVGSTTSYSNSISGGSWNSSSVSVLTIDSTSGFATAVTGGGATISYTLPTGCRVTKVLSINNLPASITGAVTLCPGNTTTLSSTTSGGTWSCSPSTVATITTGGVVTSVATGTATVTYTNAAGCFRTAVVSVNAAPAVPTGDSILCVGNTISLSTATTGGTWSSSNTASATIGATTGIVTAISSGTVNISYTISGAGCYAVKQLTVNSALSAISGSTTMCIGSSTTLSHSTTGGTWSSSDTAKATIDASGIVTGIATGSATITYTTGSGCFKTIMVVVTALPPAITGTSAICPGNTTTLSNAISGGSWTSSDASVATINVLSGLVVSVATGTTNITYTAPSGCATTRQFTVNPLPDPITGTAVVCAGSATTLTGSPSSGTWASSNASVATVGSASGVISGLISGTSTITYTLPTGCRRTTVVTVGAMPAAITGTLVMCAGGTSSLTTTTTGGTWSSSDPSIATIGSSSAVVSAVTNGTATISYNHSAGCIRTESVTVNTAPAASTGDSIVCAGGNIPLSNTTTGGSWSSSNTAIATVNGTTGLVSGVSPGTVTISYSVSGSGCFSIKTVTVNSTLATITGTTNICIGASTVLSHAVSGGTWSSSTPSKATINATTGLVTGIATGSTTITYTVSTGCYKTITLYVQNISMVVSGSLSVCTGSGSTLTCSSTGGAWTSSNTSIATINASSGLLTGVTSGTSTITYTLVGCTTLKIATVNALPDTISGIAKVCSGSTTTLTDATTGGTWSSSTPSIAAIGSASGIVTGATVGTARISYTSSLGCRRTKVVTVGAMPAAISGTATMCSGSATSLACTTTGGTWSSANTAIANITSSSGASAIITGTGAGTTTISYNHSGGCVRTVIVTVNAATAVNTGDTAICVAGTTTLSNTTTGGTWSSSNAAKATVGVTTGIVTGVSAGTVNISYRTSSTCYSITRVTVSSSTASITGSSSVCIGYTTTLGHAIGGGTWSSSDVAKATINSSTGLVSGVSVGSVTITYVINTSCYVTKSIYVNTLPTAITGTPVVCQGSFTVYTSTIGGAGTWSSSDTTIARVNSTSGAVTGVAAGTATITYRATSTGCFVTKDVTVNPLPATIAGPSALCVGASGTFTCATTGGVWSGSSSTVATIDSFTGLLNTVNAGGTTISFTVPTGCRSVRSVSVVTLPGTISGALTICAGNTTSLTSGTTGGTWSSSDTSVAVVPSATSGLVYGNSAGSATISYTNSGGCSRTTVVTVNAGLSANIGDTVVCVGQTISLTNATTGGTWTSSNTAKATAGISTGLVTGISAGSANITYSLGAGCYRVTSLIINAALATISGTTSVCANDSTVLTHSVTSGVWSSANTAIATVNAASGMVSGAAAGSTTVTYTVSSGCYRTAAMIVKAIPAAISGASTVAVGSTVTLTDATTGGTWASSATTTATVGSTTGLVSGISVGSVTISYRVTSTGCFVTRSMSVFDALARVDDDMNDAIHFTVFPNPASSSLVINSSLPGSIAIYAIDGREVYKTAILKDLNNIVLPDHVVSGVYLCNFMGSDGVTIRTVRLVVAR